MWHSATAHAQLLILGGLNNRVKIPLCKNFKAKEGMGVYSRWAYFREGTVSFKVLLSCSIRTLKKKKFKTSYTACRTE